MCICLCAFVHAHLLMCICSCAFAHVHLLMCFCSCAFVHVHFALVHLLMRICSYACVHVHLLLCICSCAFAYAHLLIRICSCAFIDFIHVHVLIEYIDYHINLIAHNMLDTNLIERALKLDGATVVRKLLILSNQNVFQPDEQRTYSEGHRTFTKLYVNNLYRMYLFCELPCVHA